ncbi:MAG: hypothetical protein OCD01_19875 [Fibrobacterales bacterium]
MLKVFQVLLLLAVFVFSDNGIYEKREIKPYFSFTTSPFGSTDLNDLNNAVFTTYSVVGFDSADQYDTTYSDFSALDYDTYDEKINWMFPIITFEAGVQYKRLLTGVLFNYTFTQENKAPYAISKQAEKPLYNTKFYTYSMGFNVGWLIFDSKSAFNIVPMTSFGFTSVNATFPGPFEYYNKDSEDPNLQPLTLKQKYYTSFGKFLELDLDLRINLNQFSISAVGGYKIVRYDEFRLYSSGTEGESSWYTGKPDSKMDSWMVGIKLTYTLLSENEKELLIE